VLIIERDNAITVLIELIGLVIMFHKVHSISLSQILILLSLPYISIYLPSEIFPKELRTKFVY
jgi:hypothetical protein